MTPQQIADAVGVGMMEKDRASKGLGLSVTQISPGAATLTMTVRLDMLNGFDICHGGFITLLADSAFAFACNSYNALTVASSLNVDFIESARLNDLLTADAIEVSQRGRTGVYDVAVRNQNGVLIAMFRGRSHRMVGRAVV
jgi:acyl-CoA thioesterase